MLEPLNEARRRIDAARLAVPRIVFVPVSRALGRLSASRLRAGGPLPPFETSAMDGYALRVGRAAARDGFRIVGAAYPSTRPSRTRLRAGEATYVTTGAPLPPGANAVARVEGTFCEGDRLRLARPPEVGQDILGRGEAMARGTTILDRGELVTPLHVGALIAQRVERVATYRLRVRILPIGDELIPAGSRSRHGVPDFIGPTVAGLLPLAEVEVLPPLPDRRAQVAHALQVEARRSDLLLTIGGSSVGRKDVTKTAVTDVGRLLFDGVTTNVLKRGSVGLIRRVPVVILPGQFVSAITVFHEHALHVVSRMVGRELRVFQNRPLTEPVHVAHRMDTTYLFRSSSDGISPLPWGVARLTAMLGADAFGVLRHGRRYRVGDEVRVQLLNALR